MFEVQILIPLADNDGEIFTTEHHASWEAAAVDMFGGFTHYPSPAVGGWLDAGEVCKDATRIYGLAVASLVDGEKVGALVRFTKAFYDQKAIFIRYLGLVEIL